MGYKEDLYQRAVSLETHDSSTAAARTAQEMSIPSSREANGLAMVSLAAAISCYLEVSAVASGLVTVQWACQGSIYMSSSKHHTLSVHACSGKQEEIDLSSR